MKINFIGDTLSVSNGLNILSQDLGFQRCDEGYTIRIIKKRGPIHIVNKNGSGAIYFEKKIHFFRALGLWLEHFAKQQEFEVIEEPQFETNGAMIDASRNGVPNVDEVQHFLHKMAIIGLNVLMLYTEDTYEVKDYPYFGYMRGRYTEEELKACDHYAEALGIEIVPCIQTLAHLTEALKWNYAVEIRDTADILLAGRLKTYKFLEKINRAASKPFRSKRIHIGMG